ncbi:MAG: phBC6A51 family helix-turn-helix protein [bacterium]|nr:phBC6A51 family helix-turn-helix protein [bacterium]
MKTDKNKEQLLERLKKTPIIQVACEKTGISRATFYRWKQEDHDFTTKADSALAEGSALVNDIAESQLMSAIKDKNMTAIIFWLKHHHPLYATRVELTGQLKHEYKLSQEEENLIAKALSMVTKNKDGK